MNRNPPIMRLRLHWLRYDLAARATPVASRRASPRLISTRPPCLVSSMPHTCADVHIRPCKCHISLMDTYLPRGAQGLATARDCRRETNYFPDERSSTPFTIRNQRGSAIFLARKERNARARVNAHPSAPRLERSASRNFFFFFFTSALTSSTV